jgi:putative Flp pilus-assembly TadE/G-like protein
MKLFKCTVGAVGVVTALLLPILLGFGSLGIEIGHWYLVERQMQGAADVAAISAGAQYVHDYNAGNQNSTAYKTVGQNYASLNGFDIPLAYVCLIDPSGVDGCGSVEAVDSRRIICTTPPCIVVEITQDTSQAMSTKASFEPNGSGSIQPIPTPTLIARAIVSLFSQLTNTTATDCVLALANDPAAILVTGSGDMKANCGVSIDGGIDQNAASPIQGGISFNGGGVVNINHLYVAAPSTNCPDNGTHCQQFGSTAALPASAVTTNTPTPDPYAPQIASLFANPPPAGASVINPQATGSGYTGPTCTFTIVGGTFYGAANTPAKFTANIGTSGNKLGQVTSIAAIIDPGAYTASGFPTGTVSATSNCGGSGATFTLTEGCWTWNGTAVPGRKYCSINIGSGTTNFPAGSYWIAGGDSCAGFCESSNTATVTSDPAGVTFFLTNGEGNRANTYATVAITSGNVTLCAPGTNCGTSCTNAAGPTSCMLFIQNPAATTSTTNGGPPQTNNTFGGNGTRTLSGLVYLPKQTWVESGSGPISGCVAVVAKYLSIGGTPLFSNGCLPGGGVGTTTVTTSLSNPHLSQ